MIPHIYHIIKSRGVRREVHTLVYEIKDIMSISEAIFHREDGPAIVDYNAKDEVVYERYYLNDKRLTKEEYEKWQIIRDLSLEVLK